MPKLDLAKARQMGYSDQQIQTYAQQRGVQLYDSTPAQPAPQPQRQGFKLTDLLPMAGGLVGSVGGSFLGPAGTIGGGALGSSAGEFFRQKLENENTSIGRILGEGALGLGGGLAGGGIKAGAKLIGKGVVKELPERLMNSVFKEGSREAKSALAKGSTLGAEALERGTKGTTKGLHDAAVRQINNTENTLQEILMESNATIPIKKVKDTVKPLLQEYRQSGNTQAVKMIEDRIAAIELQNGSKIPASLANQIKRSLYDEAQKAYGTEASASMEGIKAIARGIKESLDEIPGVSQLNKDLSFYGRQRNSMLDKMKREGNNFLGLTDSLIAGGGLISGAGVPAAATIAGRKVLGSTIGKTSIANALKKSGEIAGKVPGIVGEGASQLAGQAGVRASAGLFDGGGTEMESAPGAPIEGTVIAEGGSQAQPQLKLTPEMALLLMIKYPKQAALIKSMLDISNTKGENKTEAQVARDETGYLVDTAMQQLQNPNLKLGPIASKLEETKSIFDAGDPETLSFNRTIAALQASIAKARAGTSFTPNEQKLLDSYTPRIGDSRQQVSIKLRSLQQLFNRGQSGPSSPNYPNITQGYVQ